MKRVLRWGRSAYERDADLALEAEGVHAMGLSWAHHTSADTPWKALEEADVLVVTSGVSVNEEVLKAFRGSYLLTTTSGYDHIDLKTAHSLSKQVARLAEARRDAVVETAIGAAIQLLRRHPLQYEQARQGIWARGQLPHLAPRGLMGALVAVVGLGVIGTRMTTLLTAMGARVIGVDPAGVPNGVEAVSLDEALQTADVLSLHCCLTLNNRAMVDADALDRMKADSVLINTARGPLVDVQAAARRVASGRLRGLAVDVFPEEPYPRLSELAAIPGVLLTPHAAGYTHDLGERVAHGVKRAISAWTKGKSPEYPI